MKKEIVYRSTVVVLLAAILLVQIMILRRTLTPRHKARSPTPTATELLQIAPWAVTTPQPPPPGQPQTSATAAKKPWELYAKPKPASNIYDQFDAPQIKSAPKTTNSNS